MIRQRKRLDENEKPAMVAVESETASPVGELYNEIPDRVSDKELHVIEKSDLDGFREATNTFATWDGTKLFYRAWHPGEQADRAVILIHRGHEHSGRVRNLVRELNLEGFSAFCWDSRGHGHSPGDRGFAPSFWHIVRDLDAFSKHVTATYGIPQENSVVIANSVGAVVAATWVHDYAPRIRAMVLAAPAFSIKLYIPFALPLLRMQMKLQKDPFVTSYVRPGMLTSDPIEADAYTQDELITRNVSVKIVCQLDDVSKRIVEDAAAITTPTLVLSAGSDWVVRTAPQKWFFDQLSSEQKAYEVYPGFKHAIFHETERSKPIQRTREFILQAFESPVDRSPLQDAAGYTQQELERLSRSASLFKHAGYALTRAMMKSVGRLSDGIRLGWNRGFSSGEMLDYVYTNQPRGSLLIGGMIDRSYLGAVGWKGIRIRGEHLRARLEEAIHTQSEKQGSVHIVDIAAGAGRYVLNILDRYRDYDVSATLCDLDATALERGRSRAAYLGLTNVAWTESDAFDPEKVRFVSAGACIAIVSGLYELFSDNEPVRRSLCALQEGLAPGGLLIYTGQPWHPQLEFIARTLTHQDGSPWRMRRRTQAELDEVVRAAGFKKQGMDIDHYGIFTVSVARKEG